MNDTPADVDELQNFLVRAGQDALGRAGTPFDRDAAHDCLRRR
jgi:hypothetical protein